MGHVLTRPLDLVGQVEPTCTSVAVPMRMLITQRRQNHSLQTVALFMFENILTIHSAAPPAAKAITPMNISLSPPPS